MKKKGTTVFRGRCVCVCVCEREREGSVAVFQLLQPDAVDGLQEEHKSRQVALIPASSFVGPLLD